MRSHLLSLLVLTCATGCATHIPSTAPLLLPATPIPDPPPSTLTVNTRVILTDLGQSLNDAIDEQFDSGAYCALFGLACIRGYITREPIRLNLQGNHVRLQSMLHYQADGNFLFVSGSCGRPDNTRRRVSIAYDADLALSSDWSLRVTNPNLSITPRDRCRVTTANADATDQAMKVLNRVLGGFLQRATDSFAANTSIRDGARSAWKTLSSPIRLQQAAVLELNPQSISVAPIQTGNELLSTSITVSAKPVIFFGDASAQPQGRSADLPAFQARASNDERFRLMPVIKIPFGNLNKTLSAAAVGKEFSVPGVFGQRRVKIASTSLTGAGDRVLIGLTTEGAVIGTVWIVGRLDYRPADKIATIQLIDLDVKTKDFLLNAVKWLSPSLFLETAKNALGDFRFDVGQQVLELRERIRQGLNGEIAPTLFATAQIDPIEIRGPFTDSSNFAFAAFLDGRLQLDVRPSGMSVPTGAEVRYVSVYFETSGDDKDAEEPVTLTLLKNGRPVSSRRVGVTERWGDSPPESQGPYFVTLPVAESVTTCSSLQLRVRKEPAGSRTGKGWKNTMEARLYFADGTDKVAARSGFSQWGDGDDHPFDRTFGLCGP